MNDREKSTVSKMIRIYCRSKHSRKGLCEECQNLEKYAHNRLEKCAYKEQKPTCKNCPIHCYKPIYKEQIRIIMRYSGPRMLFFHPIAAIRHLIAKDKLNG